MDLFKRYGITKKDLIEDLKITEIQAGEIIKNKYLPPELVKNPKSLKNVVYQLIIKKQKNKY